MVCDATVIRSGLAAALPSFSWPRWREGRARCAEAPMVTVGVVAGVVERRLAAGRFLLCRAGQSIKRNPDSATACRSASQ